MAYAELNADNDAQSSFEMSLTTGDAIRTTLLNRISWGAVAAGIVISFAVMLILNLLGTAIGLSGTQAADTATVDQESISYMGALWWCLCGIVAFYCGGVTAGRLCGEPKESTAAWHGLISWGASLLLISFLMAATTGAFLYVSGPLQIIFDQQSAVLTSSQSDRLDMSQTQTTGGTGNENRSLLASPDSAQGQVRVDADTLAAASFVATIALLLGACAGWFGGRHGMTPPVFSAITHNASERRNAPLSQRQVATGKNI